MQGVNSLQNQQPNFQSNDVTYKPEYANANGKMTVRQISMIISPWKGQFERADKLIKQKETTLDSIGHSILQMDNSYDNCCKLHDDINSVVKQCSLETEKLLKQAKSFLKNQEERIKRYNQAKRLVDLIKNENTLEKGTSWLNAVQVPNHLLIQLAKDLLFQIRSYSKNVDDLENNVNALLGANGSNDLSMIESLLDMHHESILAQNTKIASLVARAEHIEGTLGKSIDMEPFIKAFHPVKSKSIIQAPKQEMSDIKAKIESFKRFNKALTGDGNGNKPIHLGNLLSPILPPNNAGNFMQQTQQQQPQQGGLFGTNQPQPTLFGTPIQPQQTSLFSPSQQPSLFGTPIQPQQQQQQQQQSGLFGSTQSNLFGSNQTKPQTGGLFGSTQTTSTGLFGTSQPQQQQQQQGGLFGSTQSTGLFGSQPQQGLFGTSQTQSTGLFGASQPQQQQQQQQQGGLFGSTQSTGLFGSTQSTGLFGSNQMKPQGGLFGTNQPQQQQQNMFGSSQPQGGLFGGTQPQQQQGMFGKTVLGTTGTFAVGSTGTAIQIAGQQQNWGQNNLFGKPQIGGGLLR